MRSNLLIAWYMTLQQSRQLLLSGNDFRGPEKPVITGFSKA